MSFTTWRVSAGANGGLSYVTLSRSGDQVTATRDRTGNGGDATTHEVWSGLNDAEEFFVTAFVFGRQDHRITERRHPLGGAPNSVTFTSPLTWERAYSLLREHVPTNS